jgi:hypothetical protein
VPGARSSWNWSLVKCPLGAPGLGSCPAGRSRRCPGWPAVARCHRRYHQRRWAWALAGPHRPPTRSWGRPIAVDLVDQFGQQLRRRGRVAKVARGGGGRGNQLAVGVDQGMPLVAVKATGAALVAMAGVGIDHRDHPVGGDLTGDPEAAIVALLQVLADDGAQQPSGLSRRRRQRAARQDPSTPWASRAGAATSAALAAWSSRSIGGLARPASSSAPASTPQLGRQPLLGHLEQPRDGRAQQRDGVHGRHRVIQRCGVQHPPHPTSPACLAASMVTAKIRSGRAEAASRAPMSTSTVWLKPGSSNASPTTGVLPAGIEAERLDASRSDRPCSRRSTITVATIRRGTLRRPTSANRSANNSSPTSRSPWWYSTAQMDCSPTRPAHTAAVPHHRSTCLGSSRRSSATPGSGITSM